MAGRIGGATEQMHSMGSKFTSEADQLEALVSRITSQLHSTDWEGGAAQRFRSQWDGEFRNVFNQVCAGLRECSAEVNKRAEALQQVGG